VLLTHCSLRLYFKGLGLALDVAGAQEAVSEATQALAAELHGDGIGELGTLDHDEMGAPYVPYIPASI
jgi:hypothetical protein